MELEMMRMFGLDPDDPSDCAAALMAVNAYELWDRLREIRHTHQVSIQHVANTLGWDVEQVELLENGGMDATLTTIQLYACAVGACVQAWAEPVGDSAASRP